MSKDYNNVPEKHIRQYGNPINKIALGAEKAQEAKNPVCAIKMYSEIIRRQSGVDSILAPYFAISKHRAEEKRVALKKLADDFIKKPFLEKIKLILP